MESIYDMDIRFELLEAQFNKKLTAQESKFIDRIKKLENVNLILAKANLDLEKEFELQNKLLESKFNTRIEELEKSNFEIIKTLTMKNLELQKVNNEFRDIQGEQLKLQAELYKTITEKITQIETQFDKKLELYTKKTDDLDLELDKVNKILAEQQNEIKEIKDLFQIEYKKLEREKQNKEIQSQHDLGF